MSAPREPQRKATMNPIACLRRACTTIALVTAVIASTAACGSGAAETATAPAPSTRSAGPTTSTSTTISRASHSTPTFTPAAGSEVVPPNQMPAAHANPGTAAVGDTVRLQGNGFVGDPWNAEDAPLYLVGGGDDCDLYAMARDTLVVDDHGQLSGTFVVPSTGDCRMAGREAAVSPGRYQLAYSCTACIVGEIEVVTAP